MDQKTIDFLHKLNHDFYNQVSVSFDQSRQSGWAGWHKLLPLFSQEKLGKFLDIGCGNARFFDFLSENLYQHPKYSKDIDKHALKTNYTGIENNSFLLKKAQEKVGLKNISNIDIFSLDFNKYLDFDKYLDEKLLKFHKFNFIVLFGFLHHVAGEDTRRQLLINLKKLLDQSGYLIISIWQLNHNRFQSKKLNPLKIFETITNLKDAMHFADQLDKNDLILGWRDSKGIGRYCRFIDRDEARNLFNQAQLKIVDSFISDGKTHDLNCYYILQK